MSKLPITAIIPTFNEEKNIARAIESVQWADELIVVDSFSTDKTLDIAEQYGAKVLQRSYVNSANQKNWAIPQAKHEWIFLLDADEQATPALNKEIEKLFKDPKGNVAFWIRRSSFFLGSKVKYSGWQGDKVIRFFMREKCRYEEKNVHAEIIADGPVSICKNRILHYHYKGIDRSLERSRWYTTWKAYDRIEKGSTGNFFVLIILKPLWKFFNHYIIKLGFLDGQVGFHIAVFSAYDVYIRGLKIMRIKAGEEIEKEKK